MSVFVQCSGDSRTFHNAGGAAGVGGMPSSGGRSSASGGVANSGGNAAGAAGEIATPGDAGSAGSSGTAGTAGDSGSAAEGGAGGMSVLAGGGAGEAVGGASSGAAGEAGAGGQGGAASIDACAHATDCSGGDRCCPATCNANDDSDCAPVCGNGVVERGESCDLSSCPQACDDTNVCTSDTLTGSVGKCDAACQHEPATCLCTLTNGCLEMVTGSPTAEGKTQTITGAPASAADGSDSSSYGISASGSTNVSCGVQVSMQLGGTTEIASLQLVAAASGGGGGQYGGGGGYAMSVTVNFASGAPVTINWASDSGSGGRTTSVSDTRSGPWTGATSVDVTITASGGGDSSGGCSITLSELRVVGKGAWALAPQL